MMDNLNDLFFSQGNLLRKCQKYNQEKHLQIYGAIVWILLRDNIKTSYQFVSHYQKILEEL